MPSAPPIFLLYQKMKHKAIFLFLIIFSALNSSAQWTQEHFVDDFGDKLKDSYIVRICNGTFNNSATSKSKLRAQCLVEVSDSLPIVRFVLFEYGSHKVNDLGGENLDLKIKLADGTTKFFNLFGNGEFASLNVNNSIKLVEIMKKESQLLKVYVERLSDYSKSTYNFTINPLGFTNAVNKLYKIDNTKN